MRASSRKDTPCRALVHVALEWPKESLGRWAVLKRLLARNKVRNAWRLSNMPHEFAAGGA